MFWKIQLWKMNRKKKYLVFYNVKRKQVWNQKLREYEWSDIEPYSSSTVMDLKVWDIKNGYLNRYGKDIWIDRFESSDDKWVQITGIMRV